MTNKGKKRRWPLVLAVLCGVILATVLACIIYVNNYYHADRDAITAYRTEHVISRRVLADNVEVYQEIDTTPTTGLIFYPGGKVEYSAYEPLMEACADRGILCILVPMPYNLAVLDMDAADGLQEQFPEIEHWYIGGHSLGGSMAASYLESHVAEYEGLILLGSYSTSDFSETDLRVFSIYGSEDQVLNLEKYEENRSNLPEDFVEVVIEGGCHAGFGMYGAQKGDGEPTITAEEQIEKTAVEIAGQLVGNLAASVAALRNPDGSYRLSEYEVELTGDKLRERIVFDVYYFPDSLPVEVTEETLWDQLWDHADIRARVLEGNETGEETVLFERSFAGAHAGNGNLAVVSYEGQKCILLYNSGIWTGTWDLWYQIWQIRPSGQEPVLLAENSVECPVPLSENLNPETSTQAIQVAGELDDLLFPYANILLNATIEGPEYCYLYGSEEGLTNGVRRQNVMQLLQLSGLGTGMELNVKDFFYPDGQEGLTELPEDAEARILAGELLCMEISEENSTAGQLDLDGDGEKETICLEPFDDSYYASLWSEYGGILAHHYRLRIDDQYYEDYCENLNPVVMAWSPDGEEILLAVFEDGPSGDPMTTFFRYDDTGLIPAGSMPWDLRDASIDEERVIKATFRADTIQTEFATGYYIWNGSEITRRIDEYYYLTGSTWREESDFPMILLEELTVYEDRSIDSPSWVMTPQEVTPIATDLEEWYLLEAEDGTRGWMHVEWYGKILSAGGKYSDEVFENLSFAD